MCASFVQESSPVISTVVIEEFPSSIYSTGDPHISADHKATDRWDEKDHDHNVVVQQCCNYCRNEQQQTTKANTLTPLLHYSRSAPLL